MLIRGYNQFNDRIYPVQWSTSTWQAKTKKQKQKLQKHCMTNYGMIIWLPNVMMAQHYSISTVIYYTK